MKFLLFLAGLLLVDWVSEGRRHHTRASTLSPTPPDPVDVRLKRLEDVINGLSRQVMLQQFFTQETTRGNGDSGLKNMRLQKEGTRNFYETAHVGARSYMAMHDHANYDRTVGLGELNPVMNGVEFRTRHNDYKLSMPSRTSKNYNAHEPIPFPDVPKSVLDKKTVAEQIAEMREYFRAFKNQNVKHRDYRPYFKANLCYLEGAWTKATDDIDEPFESDRHHIDASDWFDLMQKIQFTSYTGSKSVLENFAYLPTSIYKVENGVPLYAQWNYRIICHPVSKDIPTTMFQPLDDLLYRFPMRRTKEELDRSRAVRFTLNGDKNGDDHYTHGQSILDNLMNEIPGKDNYLADINDNTMDKVLEDVRYNNHTLLNTGFYHRYYKTSKGAMGNKIVHRGFNDANLWVAQTTNPKIIDMTVTSCQKVNNKKTCTPISARYTYALPLEIVYTTPLSNWNPYDLPEWPSAAIVTNHGTRFGKNTPDKAYNGTCSRLYYKTPTEFYSGKVEKDPADTAKSGVGVLDRDGQVRMVASAGIRINTPSIGGVGPVRLRFPIMPVHGEGAGVWKELNALKEMTMHMNRYSSLFVERPGTLTGNSSDVNPLLHFQLATTHQDPPGEHNHDFFLTPEEYDELKTNHMVTVTTSEDLGHSHILQVYFYREGKLKIKLCDGKRQCWDGHSPVISLIKA